MTIRKLKEHGQALIVIALSSIALFAFAGLAIDGTIKLSDRRHAQNAADTAALAAALSKVTDLTNGVSDNSPTTSAWATCPPPVGVQPSPVCANTLNAGKARAATNGYTNDITNSVVEVYSPPIFGYYSTVSNSDEYIQVIITSHVKTSIMRVLGINQTDNKVSAIAYAKKGGNLANGAMIISYDPSPNCSVGGTGGYSVEVTGNSTVNLFGGGFFVNSDEVCGFTIPNCADLKIHGGTINTVGASNVNMTGCTFSPPFTPNYNQDPVVIPDEVYWPDRPIECTFPATSYPVGSTYHITPGYYTNFPQQTINGDLFGTKQDIVMDPGVYCVGKDIKWSGNTFNSLDGSSGVTIYLESGNDFSLSLNAPITLTAPSSGDYQGYLIIQEGDPSYIGSCIINGGAYLEINGLIYAPYCDITVNGKAGETAQINAQLVGWDIKINGSNTINFNYDPNNQVKTKRQVGLMK